MPAKNQPHPDRGKWKKHKDYTGERFGNITVVKRIPKPEHLKNKAVYWECKCDCGKSLYKMSQQLSYFERQKERNPDRLHASCGCGIWRTEYSKRFYVLYEVQVHSMRQTIKGLAKTETKAVEWAEQADFNSDRMRDYEEVILIT